MLKKLLPIFMLAGLTLPMIGCDDDIEDFFDDLGDGMEEFFDEVDWDDDDDHGLFIHVDHHDDDCFWWCG